MSFNPWNGAGAQNFKPLGSLNRARQPVYQASAGLRTEQPPAPQTSRCPFAGIARLLLKPVGALVKLLEAALLFSNRLQFPWDRWAQISPWLGVLNLVGLRTQLRQHNLCDTETPASLAEYENLPQSCPVMSLVHRTADGSRNDLSHPHMGRALTRFGRNIPLESVKRPTAADLLTPNPRTVARELMTRTTFQPVAQLNLLAAAWIQFMVHDWLFHEVDPTQSVEIPIEDPDWPSDQQPMRVLRTAVDPLAAQDPPGHPTSFVNRETHWWDGSQLYGSTPELQQRVRTHQGGKLWIQERGLLPIYENPGGWTDHNVMAVEETGVRDNWWLGLGLLHSLFTLEHNAIAEHLHAAYPSWDDEHLFQTARLINTALLAKIHTVEWTPAILDNPALEIGMNGNWWGIAGERIHKLLGRLSDSEVLSGIPGSTKDHFGVTYAMTEEFTSVYRLHPLLPDELVFHTLLGGRIDTLQMPWMTEPQSVASLGDVVGPKARAFMESPQWEMADLFYSFGLMHPGAIALHNYPNFLRQSLTHVDAAGAEHLIDLAAVEIFRDRERGVPRYNEFRQLLHKPPVRSFEELTGGNRAEADRIRAVYHNRLDDVDLLVGLMAEQPLPQGFGFSDTAFRIFILMASRRLNSDRFFTTDYTPEVYTPEGLQWIANNTLTSVLLRQFPQLAPALRQSKNAFAPWQRVS
ncbi:peroxidase [Synechococcales cyanobacterium C]|uniref:Peroxidase n=2 Tax=Petrachloros TaxID=2918834 RepID=A0A8K2A952_9CYAN|nr:peroxidase [Petrachloros mirabilis ULC683]